MISKLFFLHAMVFMLSALPFPTRATPADVIDIQDELFGVSQAEVFALRTVSDNLGSHSNLVSTVFLVAIDRATGEETIWPIHRARVQPVDRVQPDGAQAEILADVLADARNPFEILAQRNGIPSGATAQSPGLEPTTDASLTQSPEALYADLKRLTATLATKTEPYGRPGALTIAGLLSDPMLSSDDCSAGSTVVLRPPADIPPVRIARIICGLAENGFRISVLRPVPVNAIDHAIGSD